MGTTVLLHPVLWHGVMCSAERVTLRQGVQKPAQNGRFLVKPREGTGAAQTVSVPEHFASLRTAPKLRNIAVSHFSQIRIGLFNGLVLNLLKHGLNMPVVWKKTNQIGAVTL